MKIFTKEWHRLLDSSNNADMYEPIEDRDYTDEEINAMSQTLPECIREAVDPRLLALNLLPESVYNKLKAEDEKAEARFEELDEITDEKYEKMLEDIPEQHKYLIDAMDDLQSDYIIDICVQDDDYIMKISTFNEDGEGVKKKVIFKNVDFIEDEEPYIFIEVDEDGDIVSNCELAEYELYCKDDSLEIHMLYDNGNFHGLKYVTLKCDDIVFEESAS